MKIPDFLDQLFLNALYHQDLHTAFKWSFLSKNLQPTSIQNSICAGWKEYFKNRKDNLKCSECLAPLALPFAFTTSCGHFYCSPCAGYLPLKIRQGKIRCTECMREIEAENPDHTFLRPL